MALLPLARGKSFLGLSFRQENVPDGAGTAPSPLTCFDPGVFETKRRRGGF